MSESNQSTSMGIFGKLLRFCGSVILLVILEAAIAFSYIISAAANLFVPFIKANYKHNSGFSFSDFIHDQKSGAAADMKMGYYKASYNGCGWIATYNASLMQNMIAMPADIIRFYDSHGGTLIVGAFGVNPLSVKHYFRKAGIRARFYCLTTRHDLLIRDTNAAILTYFHQKGAHFVAVKYRNGNYYVYNDANRTAPLEMESIDAWLNRKRYHSFSLICI